MLKKINKKGLALSLAIAAMLSGCNEGDSNKTKPSAETLSATQASNTVANPSIWPKVTSKVAKDAKMEADISAILSGMTLEQKVAQMIQPEIRAFSKEDMKKYGFGSYLNGGGAFPNDNKHSTMADWVALADDMYEASIDDSIDGSTIPTMWGTDAVHGHNNVVKATIFPHNIGLGAMHNPKLMQQIGAATAKVVQVTGIDWVFAPTVAVVRDDRWGRTYEGYSEDPAIVKEYARAMVIGMQGEANSEAFMGDGTVIATAKHFLGDGGTDKGDDQGNNLSTEQELIDIHAQGYISAIEEGVQTIMASFNSWNGEKMHGNKSLLTDVLKKQMGFDGLVVGDWDGHGQVKGCSNASCAQAINAGVDIIMVPNEWKPMFENTVAQVKSGEISEARINDAVTRILRVKMRAGIFDGVKPSDRAFAAEEKYLGSVENRAIARQAVRESLVLLKNQNKLLPLDRKMNVLMAGSGADNIGKQSGGWTLSWQGTGNVNSDFPGATSIYDGVNQVVTSAGGKVELSENGNYQAKPDVAIVVFGENPYAEGVGDIEGIEYQLNNKRDINLLQKLKADGIPVVSVFLTGRPLWVNKELNASDAFVAAWLPGSEGVGVSDVLFKKADGSINYDFKGKLTYSWPKYDDQVVINKGDKDYAPLYPYGYGLTYSDVDTQGDDLPEEAKVKIGRADDEPMAIFDSLPQSDLGFFLGDKANWVVPIATSVVTTHNSDNLTMRTYNWKVQEDARQLIWKGDSKANAFFAWPDPHNMQGMLEHKAAYSFSIKVDKAPAGDLTLGIHCMEECGKKLVLNEALSKIPAGEWGELTIDLACIADAEALAEVRSPFMLSTDAPASIVFGDVKLVPSGADSAAIKCD
ncbi:glycoside hydrolase family 3 protein [Saccharophagus degradans]|uniref:Glycoside hydrolase family 3 N-terminal domain-containing protein n=1 Tax=Saccharophagus degradans TaxID=86304 RepID=A0AAW7X6V4_9GAMM|nr:glycoside hydrolase family 3 protein [Saccharophagus degradans]MDO6423317.1 glycoside hydrolase family 3 N-terminal domain-containing protein [Saccharophagus degradans]MDO6606722.1 glycoside hydrolase family 3 N-terminal domain-containing protein [Saccharophagus degradans]